MSRKDYMSRMDYMSRKDYTLEELDIFSFNDNVDSQYKKKPWHSPKRLELQTLGRPQNS